MKRATAGLLIFLLAAISLGANSIKPPNGLAGKLWASTFALYGTKDGQSKFLCSAELIGKSNDGYVVLSAGHCVQESPANLQFSLAENISAPLMAITLTKAFDGPGIDFAIFDFPTKAVYPVMGMDDESALSVGDILINPNFARGFGKQLSFGTVGSAELPLSPRCTVDDCAGVFIAQIYGSNGSSGSAVVSAKTHKIVGIVIYGFDDTVGFGVEPISRIHQFMIGPNQQHPAPLPISVIQ